MGIRTAVVGGGAWGTALASHAARLGHETRIWAFESEVVEAINTHHENTLFLADTKLPESLRASSNVSAVVSGADLVILAPPSQHLRGIAESVAPFLASSAHVVVASKGIEESTLELLSAVLAEALPSASPERIAFLSGPSFAREVASGLPTDVVVASDAMTAARAVQPLLHSPLFRVYTSDDPVGVQIGGALKNVIAIAAGAGDGLGLGANARAAIITRGLAEMTRLGVALGANPLTFLGMSGVGDLVLTCTGDLSRNRSLGVAVAKGADPEEYVKSHRSVAEGYYTCAAAYALAKKRGVDMPVTEQVFQVLHRGRPLLKALHLLMNRDYKEELHGIRATP